MHKLSEEDEKKLEVAMDQLMIAKGGDWGPDTLTLYGPDSRIILVSGEITAHLADCVISQLLYCINESDTEPIVVHLNSEGGDIVSALAIYDAMRLAPVKVKVVVTGYCMSAALVILQGGDERISFPNATFFFHEPMVGVNATSEIDVNDSADQYKHLRQVTSNILLKRSTISRRTWNRYFKHRTSYHFDAEQAFEYGFLDNVMEYPDKNLEVLEELVSEAKGVTDGE